MNTLEDFYKSHEAVISAAECGPERAKHALELMHALVEREKIDFYSISVLRSVQDPKHGPVTPFMLTRGDGRVAAVSVAHSLEVQ